MNSMTEHRIIGGTLALLVLCGTASAQEVGKAAAVNPAATANLRTIAIGSSIAHKERIQTATGGSVQLLFLDKTTMTIGPNSDLTIDEYVFDPTGNTGKIAATLGKGALRFVGGQISHNGDAEIRTANAVIGIRGGTAFISPEHVYTGYGLATVNSGGTRVALRTGEFTETEGGANPPTPPGRPPAGFVAALVQKFQSSGKQTGGTTRGLASPARVAAAEARATGSSKRTAVAVAHEHAVRTMHAKTSTRTAHAWSSTSHHSSIVHSIVQSLHTSSQTAAVVGRK
ncbi:FecR domain-containing protein [Bradyrhizobium erythrophlei]|uniref:FecR family protein n=1 Tax=Bradyrhizobium erythrophlei TaxID=1437360 RepID=UPI0035EF80DB